MDGDHTISVDEFTERCGSASECSKDFSQCGCFVNQIGALVEYGSRIGFRRIKRSVRSAVPMMSVEWLERGTKNDSRVQSPR